ncbi:MAG: UDP-N-acetylglucosamine 1-carboxyvinyltransferase [Bacteroidetes bacterium]|nr:UDP-N-acetylglucosamine 1-carboxyvinyltransferase [Bacteroidota bacterium]
MNSFEITGGKKLGGEIFPQGAKNEALQIICSSILTAETVTVHNLPNIRDVNKLIELLQAIGTRVVRISESSCSFQTDDIDFDYFQTPDFREKVGSLRGSIMILGPMLARFGRGIVYIPGGDKIGRRRLDTHFLGLQKLGATFEYNQKDQIFSATAQSLTGAYMLLDEASVTATANIVMAATLAKGVTTIFNAACEPYIVQLCTMLVSMGALINGIGSNLLTITGVEKLGGNSHTLLSDMIEVGSFIGLAAMTGSEITIKNVNYHHLGLIPEVFKRMGIRLEKRDDDIFVPAQEHYEIETFMDGSIMTIADAPWPGFTPDLISIVLVIATQAKGSVLIHQKMFESRLFFVDKLIDMGARIILCDPHRATVIGLDRKYQLRGIRMSSPDIRAGVALLIAALSAEGKSVIDNIEQIDRGYQQIDQRLIQIGAEIKRISG